MEKYKTLYFCLNHIFSIKQFFFKIEIHYKIYNKFNIFLRNFKICGIIRILLIWIQFLRINI